MKNWSLLVMAALALTIGQTGLKLPGLKLPDLTHTPSVSLDALAEAAAPRVLASPKISTTRRFWEFWETACEAASVDPSPLDAQLAAAIGESPGEDALPVELTSQHRQALAQALRDYAD